MYGIHTTRSMQNFNMGNEILPLEIIYGMATLKKACAEANCKLGLLDSTKADAIMYACDAICARDYDDSFPIDVFHAGSGTSSNMNTNEVIANIAAVKLGGKPGDRHLVHPNDDVNKGQSTNNIFPSAIRVACINRLPHLTDAINELTSAFDQKAEEFDDVLKSGRTHLQDAVPVTLGQEMAAYARALRKNLKRAEMAGEFIKELGVGGNAVGTGINTKAEFRAEIIAALNDNTGEEYRVAENGLEGTQFLTDMCGMSAALKMLATDLLKIVNDLRLLSSGPNTGIGEIILPPVEPGSSIMPGKINPSICEAANMACIQVLGYDHAISIACTAGQLELNTHMPLVGMNLIKSFNTLSRVCQSLARKCISGITADVEVCNRNFEISAGLATVLNPLFGYDKVAVLVKESLKTGKTLKQLVKEKELLPADELEALLKKSTGPTL
jgi:aspartate ammonia-lyase